MTTTISSKGQIVIPREIRQRAHIKPGDDFSIKMEKDEIRLKKIFHEKPLLRAKLVKGKYGLPLFKVPRNAPPLTNELIKEIEGETW